MSNMAYCRFHNTLADLRDVAEHIMDDNLSEDENKARKRLVKLCFEIAQGFMDDEGNLDRERLEEIQSD